MTTVREGRGIGVLLILQLAAGLILPFVLIGSLLAGYPSYLETAAANAGMVRGGVALALFGAALTVAIGIAMLPRLSEYSRPLALAFTAICLISATLDLVHNATVLSMLSASEQYAKAGTDTAIYQAWGIAAASIRRSAHIMQLVAVGAWIFTFYFSVLKFRLVPRPLAALGIIGILGQFTGVTLMMFLGNPPISYLAMPLAPIHIITAIWIIARGFPSNGSEQTATP